MTNGERWRSELDLYIRQCEPNAKEKSIAWKTAIGLQKVDGLGVSAYLLDTAKEHIEGKISIREAQERIYNYHKAQNKIAELGERTEEADIVAVRITELLGEKTFHLSPVFWQNIHKRLFIGVFAHAGQLRGYNITKDEWVLGGDSVIYVHANSVPAALEHDFNREREYSYSGNSIDDSIEHFAKFTAGIWQIHPFSEGNTRSMAVFVIKYLQSLGFSIDGDVFAKHSLYFRNALVRANYNNLQQGIEESAIFLVRFYDNLVLGKGYDLTSTQLKID